jgi:tetratricopeptide (TPR) repeat protein
VLDLVGSALESRSLTFLLQKKTYNSAACGVFLESGGAQLSLEAEFARAVAQHRRGELSEAERTCRQILGEHSRHAGANHLLGVIALQRGAFALADERIAVAIAANPNVPSAHRHRGAALAQLGRFPDALSCFESAIALNPNDSEALAFAGNALQELKRYEEALACYDRAIALRPGVAATSYNRGLVLSHLGRFSEALASLESAIALKADYAAAHDLRGGVLLELKRFSEALATFESAIALTPGDATLHYNRGIALQELSHLTDAIASYEKAIALRPGYAGAFNNRGNALKDLERFEEALASYEQAINHSPDFARAHYNRGIALLELNRPMEALASYDKAIALKPDFAEALTSRGMCKLALGLEDTAWNDFEQRWKLPSPPPLAIVPEAPLWTGEDLAGRSILVCADGGNGDVLQFGRFVPLLAQKGAQVGFLAPERLHALLKHLPGNIRLLSPASAGDAFDFYCALMSLPSRLNLHRTKTPLAFPYLAVDPARSAQWRHRLGGHGFKIGIAWQGTRWRGGPAGIVGRWMKLAEFYPLSRVPDVRLISLQRGEGTEQLTALPGGMTVETLGDDFDSGPDAFADTAAAMQHLDLIISCDTAIAHLAGALNRPTWIALQHVPEWRWGLSGDTSPWYPSVRLFRQPRRGDWSSVFAEMAAELAKVASIPLPEPTPPNGPGS